MKSSTFIKIPALFLLMFAVTVNAKSSDVGLESDGLFDKKISELTSSCMLEDALYSQEYLEAFCNTTGGAFSYYVPELDKDKGRKHRYDLVLADRAL